MDDRVKYSATTESEVLVAERASDWGMGGARLLDRGQLVDALDRAVT
jgi:hypothetical protein